MAKLIRLDETGDTVLAEWDVKDAEKTARAREVFDSVMATKTHAAVADEEIVRKFNPNAEVTVFVRQIQGG